LLKNFLFDTTTSVLRIIVDPTKDNTSFLELETDLGFCEDRKDWTSIALLEIGVTGA
jgi:hypothetical protein